MTRLHISKSILIPGNLVDFTGEPQNSLLVTGKDLKVPANSNIIIGDFRVIIAFPTLNMANLLKTQELVDYINEQFNSHHKEDNQILLLNQIDE